MLRFLSALFITLALAGQAAADHPPDRGVPMTREMYQRQIEFWNDRADLARLFDLQVTFEGAWRFYDPAAIRRVDDRVLRFFDDQLAEANRELARDLREQRTDRYGRRGGDDYQYDRSYQYDPRHARPIQRVSGDDPIPASRQEIAQLRQLQYQYRTIHARADAQSLAQKHRILAQLIDMEQAEVQRDGRLLRSQGWVDPLRQGTY